MFVLLSGDEQIIACGDLFQDGVVYFSHDEVVSFDLPLEQQQDSKKCSGGINDILAPLQWHTGSFYFPYGSMG